MKKRPRSFKRPRQPFQPKSQPLEYAIRSLVRKRQTERQIREKLTKYFPELDQEPIISRLKELDYLNDQAFCEAWIRHRSITSPRGAYLLRRELQHKGVAPDTIDQALGGLNTDSELEHLASTRWARIKEPNAFKKQQKLLRFLLSRGFQLTEAREMVKQIASAEEE